MPLWTWRPSNGSALVPPAPRHRGRSCALPLLASSHSSPGQRTPWGQGPDPRCRCIRATKSLWLMPRPVICCPCQGRCRRRRRQREPGRVPTPVPMAPMSAGDDDVLVTDVTCDLPPPQSVTWGMQCRAIGLYSAGCPFRGNDHGGPHPSGGARRRPGRTRSNGGALRRLDREWSRWPADGDHRSSGGG